MIIEHFQPFTGQHCETTATGSLLLQLGINLSEPMLFGLGEGLSYIFWNMKSMEFPFIGGRIKPGALTQNIANNLALALDVQETSSPKKAWEHVAQSIDNNIAVGLQLDCYHLEYFTSKIHFAGHYVAMYGYDDNYAYLVDTEQQGGMVTTSLHNLALARSEKGPMASKNLAYTIHRTDTEYDIATAIQIAIGRNAQEYLTPPIQNISYKGILKTSKEIQKWFRTSTDVKRDFQTTALIMERAGTGGALFRNLYRDFLWESYNLLQVEVLQQAYQEFVAIAELWVTVSSLFHQAGETHDSAFIDQASDILVELSEREHRTMQMLQEKYAP